MGVYQTILRPALFQVDPEAAHESAVHMISLGLVRARKFEHSSLRQNLFGVHFKNPLGLAAGFDKNAIAIDHWHRLGFGFTEVGTITAEPQEGNPKPRLIRLPKDEAIINRMGFNNDGARVIAGRIASSSSPIPLGINIGKTKNCPIENAAEDYATSFKLLSRYGSYFVINVSSPNTPELRSLQTADHLTEIVGALREAGGERPLFVKVAPDLEAAQVDEIVKVVHDLKLTGIIAVNTTISRPGLQTRTEEEGGLSGKPLRGLANKFMRNLYVNCDRNLILIGVGGIMNGDDLYDRIASGAHLCQIYTGWVYGGPKFVTTALKRLVELMKERGFKNVAELRGSAIKATSPSPHP